MAKQQVSAVERHVEKVVLGVCAAVLLAAIVLFGISTPNTVEIGGEPVGPSELYERIGSEADSAIMTLQGGSSYEEVALPDLGSDLNPLSTAALPAQLGVAAIPPSPEVPYVEGVGPRRRKVDLVKILAPGVPEVATGRAAALLPPMQVVALGESAVDRDRGSSAEGLIEIAQGVHWVSLAGVVFRKAQNDASRAANYDDNRVPLIVAGLEIERQRLGEDSVWSQPQIVIGYNPVVYRDKRVVTLVQQEDMFVLLSDDEQLIQTYTTQFGTLEGQAEALRPSFQELLDLIDADRWSLPRKLTGMGYDIDLTKDEWGPLYFALEDKAGSSSNPGAADAAIRKKASEIANKIDLAVRQGNWEAVVLLLDEFAEVGGRSAPVNIVTRIETIEEKHASKIAQARNVQTIAEQNLATKLEREFGYDYDPYWATDTTVVPGAVYRYRVRVLAVNRFAGIASRLMNPMDAAKMILPGDWSEWSNPVEIKPSAYLLATGNVRPENRSADVWVYSWERGKWDNEGRRGIKIGDTIKLGENGPDSRQVLVDVADDRVFGERQRNGTIRLEQVNALTVVNADGEAVEHFSAVDKDLRARVRSIVSEDEKRHASTDEGRPRKAGARPGRPQPARNKPARNKPARGGGGGSSSSGGGS